MAMLRGVVNLSDRPMSDAERTLLLRGLKFCPTPNMPDPGMLRDDLDALHRRLGLKSHFEQDDQNTLNTTTPSQVVLTDSANLYSTSPFKCRKFKLPSKWKGPVGPTTLHLLKSG